MMALFTLISRKESILNCLWMANRSFKYKKDGSRKLFDLFEEGKLKWAKVDTNTNNRWE